MKKILSVFLLAGLTACDSPDQRPRNDDNTLSAIWVNVPGADENSARYNGVFNASKDSVFIQVPFKTTSGIDVDLKKLKFRGSIPSDATAIPAMGLMDMSAPVRIDVISGLQHVKSYIIKVTQK
jgi:hypothetical protein